MGAVCCGNSQAVEDGTRDLKRPKINSDDPCDIWVNKSPFAVTLCTTFIKFVDDSSTDGNVDKDKLLQHLNTPAWEEGKKSGKMAELIENFIEKE